MFKTLLKNVSLTVKIVHNCVKCNSYLAPQVEGDTCPDCLNDAYIEKCEKADDLSELV